MTVYRTLTGSRLVETRHGDTLQKIAARELGDASKWADIIVINDLIPPYLTADSSQASARVKLFGQLILVPAATARVSAEADPDMVFGVDLDLTNGLLASSDGDFRLVAGRPNLHQALVHRVSTGLGELLFHLNYGLRRLLGVINGPTTGLLAAQYVKGALLSDPRIESVPSCTADIVGDKIQVTASAVPIAGTPITISTEVSG